jgi:GT2 family glycosyltransferase
MIKIGKLGMASISIIIVNYNGKGILKDCLTSVFANLKNIEYEVIISDNGSTDGSVGIVKKEFPAVRIVENRANIGFAAANNRAAKVACGEYLFLLNPDTVILDRDFAKIVRFMGGHKDAGAAGPLVLSTDGTMQRQCKRGWPTFRNSFFYYSGLWRLFPRSRAWKKISGGYFCLDKPDDAVCEVDQLSGAAMLVRRDIWEFIGGMDEKYIMYWDDTDLCFRIKNNGFKIYYVPYCKITHYGGAGGAQLHALRNLWYFHKGACVFYHRYLEPKSNFIAFEFFSQGKGYRF